MRKLIILGFIFLSSNIFSQDNKQSAFIFSYDYKIPMGELAAIYGNNSSIGLTYFKEKENNLFFGIEGNYIFGENIKKNTLFNNISTSNGNIIGADGTYANIILLQRGFEAYIFVGYAYHHQEKDLSGIYLSSGLGYLQQQIFIDTKNQDIPQLNNEMKKGYDRLSNGISTKWQASYRYYSKNGKFQAYAGINITMSYAKNIRPYIFNSMRYNDDNANWQKIYGATLGIIIPIERKNEEEFHYY